MFPYDPELLAAVQVPSQSIADVLRMMQTIEDICADGDGLKWFNWLYLRVTQAVETQTSANGFGDAAWMEALDVEFAGFYFAAIQSRLSGGAPPGCWRALFEVRNQAEVARIQFALAGMNAHINHDLPQAVLNTCKVTAVAPQHGTIQYNDYTALNDTLGSLVDAAKTTLRVRLLGESLPPVSTLDNTLAAWGVSAAREAAWNNAELLYHLNGEPLLTASLLDTIDGLTAVAGKTLLVPVPIPQSDS